MYVTWQEHTVKCSVQIRLRTQLNRFASFAKWLSFRLEVRCSRFESSCSLISVFQLFLLILTKFSFCQGEPALGHHSMKFRHFPEIVLFPKILSLKLFLQLVRQLVYTMFISNNCPSFHLLWKKNLVKDWEISKYYKTDCRFSMASVLKKGRNKIRTINWYWYAINGRIKKKRWIMSCNTSICKEK